MMIRFTEADADRASEEWGANCGPGALAAIMGLSLDEVRPHMAKTGFMTKGYVNPTMMLNALNSVGAKWQAKGRGKTFPEVSWPTYGLARIQWEGPWTEPGMNAKWAYTYTHWVGSWIAEARGHGVFDINMIGNGSGWGMLEDWERTIVPAITSLYKRANGKWHITHAIEVEKL